MFKLLTVPLCKQHKENANRMTILKTGAIAASSFRLSKPIELRQKQFVRMGVLTGFNERHSKFVENFCWRIARQCDSNDWVQCLNHIYGLTKRFGDRVAVNAISFSIAEGETVGLLGPNGAGKTTAIAMISGISRPDGGEVRLGGVALAEDANALKQRVGLVPQDLALYEELSAWANLQLFGGLYGLGAAELEPRARAALALVGLAERSKDRVKTFSGGMKRRLNIAGALLHEPDLILLDEPTVGVDPQSRNAIFDNLEELKRRGKTLLYTTHYMEEAERLCDRVLILDHGQILANDTVVNFKRQYTNLEAAFMQLTGRALRDRAEA